MFLSDVDIKKAVEDGDIILEPFIPNRLQPTSYDLRLANVFIFSEDTQTPFIDPTKRIFAKTREIELPDGAEFVLHPGVSILARSKERFGSNKYLIQLGGKSSLARIGLSIHNTAGIINPGHFLHITLEITNQNNIPIILRPGMEIAQITFSTISSPPSRMYQHTGRFAKDNWQHFAPKRTAAPKKKRATKKKK